MNKIILVACSATKLDRPAPARELYSSTLFQKARRYAELTGRLNPGGRWYILSALHGLVEPETVIEPYDKSLNRMPYKARMVWGRSVCRQLAELTNPETDKLIFLAGKSYRQPLLQWVFSCQYQWDAPLAGLGIGQQMQWLNQEIEKMGAQTK